uniref:Uncharacterized protein n=1 Tax=Romanomermis culicivorax TaxID=13658 RepID=A0A915KS19_ROMCU
MVNRKQIFEAKAPNDKHDGVVAVALFTGEGVAPAIKVGGGFNGEDSIEAPVKGLCDRLRGTGMAGAVTGGDDLKNENIGGPPEVSANRSNPARKKSLDPRTSGLRYISETSTTLTLRCMKKDDFHVPIGWKGLNTKRHFAYRSNDSNSSGLDAKQHQNGDHYD